ncbi:MAG: flagellar basal-body rod protein FlgF [Alphaproteobacteria bacterium]
MDNTAYIGLSRQTALWRQLDMVSNNIANANTPAFKNQQPMFVEYLVKTQNNERPFDDKLSFVQDLGTFRDTRDGPMTSTGNPLDLALNGPGYLVVDTDAGPMYTRGGHLRLNEAGQMVTADGQPILSSNDQPFFFAPNETQISVARDGTVTTENGQIGKLRVVRFEDEQQLRQVSGGLYMTEQRPEEVARPDVLQGMLEESNVKPVVEMTRMIQLQRSYESSSRLVEQESDRRRKVIDALSRVA